MDSTQLNKIVNGLSRWFHFDKRVLKQVPKQGGIYVIRLADAQIIGRLQGESDILYIGSSKSKGGLRQRISQYFHPGPTQFTNRRIRDLTERYPMEIAWFPCDEPVNIENNLLRQYISDHDELPPLNHADVKRLYKSLTASIKSSYKLTVT